MGLDTTKRRVGQERKGVLDIHNYAARFCLHCGLVLEQAAKESEETAHNSKEALMKRLLENPDLHQILEQMAKT